MNETQELRERVAHLERQVENTNPLAKQLADEERQECAYRDHLDRATTNIRRNLDRLVRQYRAHHAFEKTSIDKMLAITERRDASSSNRNYQRRRLDTLSDRTARELIGNALPVPRISHWNNASGGTLERIGMKAARLERVRQVCMDELVRELLEEVHDEDI